MRYVKQRDYFSCGPVAIINACKWAGKKLSVRNDFQRLIRVAKTRRSYWIDYRWHGGTNQQQIDRVLRKELKGFATVQRASNLSLKELKRLLKKEDTSAVILYAWRFNREGNVAQAHYVFCPNVVGDDLVIINSDPHSPSESHHNLKHFLIAT